MVRTDRRIEHRKNASVPSSFLRYRHGVLKSLASVKKTCHAATLCAAVILLMCGCAGNQDATGHVGVVSGHVLTAPVCPVQRVGQECPPRPVSGSTVVAVEGTTTRGSTRTDSAGAFHLTLPDGRYVITATNVGGYPSTSAETVSISDAPVRITLILDSGIR